MRDRLLTYAEKKAIRTMPCGKCRAKPPYVDGAWTQKHRLIPASKGGKYTIKNTVPRCPSCHAKEPGHNPALLRVFHSGRKGGLKSKGKKRSGETRARYRGAMARRMRSEEYRSEASRHARNVASRKAGLRMHEVHPEYASTWGPKFARKGGLKSVHVRCHVRRGIVKQDCPFCN